MQNNGLARNPRVAERIIKKFNAPLQQINMIMYAAGVLLATTVYATVPSYHEKAFFEGYSPMVWLLIWVQATYGLCVGYAYKYADVLIKNLSTSATEARTTCLLPNPIRGTKDEPASFDTSGKGATTPTS